MAGKFRFFSFLVILCLSFFLLAAARQAQAEATNYFPGCVASCGPATGCPTKYPYCSQVVIPCDFRGVYKPGGLPSPLLCCNLPPSLGWCRGKKTPEPYVELCSCVCAHKNTDPYLKSHANEFTCDD